MAKSKSGGTRSYLRGRVGADVYSIGRDAKGKKQQVVRSLAETVANPQTLSQMRGRMIMSTLMQVVSILRPIVDHSFDNVQGKQANVSEFIARNYKLIKADVAAHPATGNQFGLVAYQERIAKRGAYVIADGKALVPANLEFNPALAEAKATIVSGDNTIANLKAALGFSTDDYFTIVGITTNGEAAYLRLRINPNLDDATEITASNVGTIFATEGNATAKYSFGDGIIAVTLTSAANCSAIIISKKTESGYIHNEAVLAAPVDIEMPADVALPTYPVGSQDYLNGGDIFGAVESATASEASAGSGGGSGSGGASGGPSGAGDTGNGD